MYKIQTSKGSAWEYLKEDLSTNKEWESDDKDIIQAKLLELNKQFGSDKIRVVKDVTTIFAAEIIDTP